MQYFIRQAARIALGDGRLRSIDVLWPGLPVHHGRHRLRNVLARLHTPCGHLVERAGTSLVPQANTDMAAFTRTIAALPVHVGQKMAPDVRFADRAEAARQHLTVASEPLAGLI